MSSVKRQIDTNRHGYREVNLVYRGARAAMMDNARVGERTARICCPMLDACRSASAYGQKALRKTDAPALKEWSEAVGVSSVGIKAVAYASGPWYRILPNVLLGRFEDTEVNTGFVRSLKHGIDTGVLARGTFNQQELNQLVWALHPQLAGTPMTSEWLYTVQSAEFYLDASMLPKVLTHNVENGSSGQLGRGLGLALSTFEMKKLLFGPLSQEIRRLPGEPLVKAISLRDLHDFFKYGLLPVQLEERFVAAGLLTLAEIACQESTGDVAASDG
jgi:hypothetical protein